MSNTNINVIGNAAVAAAGSVNSQPVYGPQTQEEYLYHNTELLLKNYRQAKCSLMASKLKLEKTFDSDYLMEVGGFVGKMYNHGFDTGGVLLEDYAKSMAKTAKIIETIDQCLTILKENYPNGEELFAILELLYITNKTYSTDAVMELMEDKGYYYCKRVFFRKRKEAINALSVLLWGYTAQNFIEAATFID